MKIKHFSGVLTGTTTYAVLATVCSVTNFSQKQRRIVCRASHKPSLWTTSHEHV